MVINEYLKKIINNFSHQCHLYKNMEYLSRQQLMLLEKKDEILNTAILNEILAQRQKLITDISSLNDQNKIFQQQVKQELGIEEFVISSLENKIDEQLYIELKSIIAEMAKELTVINNNDEKSQFLMRQGSSRKVRKATDNQASSAYRQTMQQKSPDTKD